MSRKDILEEASSEDIEYLQAIMNKKSISKEKNSFMKNTGTVILCIISRILSDNSIQNLSIYNVSFLYHLYFRTSRI